MNGGISLAHNTGALELKVIRKLIFLLIGHIIDLLRLCRPLLWHPAFSGKLTAASRREQDTTGPPRPTRRDGFGQGT
uniref:Si946076e12 n=1 Tax=Arundo donax TaxID=35708 RepID=A0A0A9DUB9_ARUDO